MSSGWSPSTRASQYGLSNSAHSVPPARASTRTPGMPRSGRRGVVGAAGDGVGRGRHVGGGAELVLETPARHLELHGPDRGEDGRLIAQLGVAQHLHHTLLVELRHALAELLEPARVAEPGR